jgi:hypothetical protein
VHFLQLFLVVFVHLSEISDCCVGDFWYYCRDIVEVRLDLAGVPCILSDTAGLRGAGAGAAIAAADIDGAHATGEEGLNLSDSNIDPIEQEGMLRARYVLLA